MPRRWPDGCLLALLLLEELAWVQGCRTAAAPEPGPVGVEPGTGTPWTPAPSALSTPVPDADVPPGFRADTIEAPVFGGQAFVIEGGRPDCPLVVLVHGLGESGARDFYPVMPALAEAYHVIAIDLPGFGRSTHGTLLYSPERYASFVRAVVRQRFAGPFNLVGHSMGGAISLMLAARFPADLERLFLIDAAGFLHRKAFVNFAVASALDNVLGVWGGAGKGLLDDTLQAALQGMGPLPSAPEPDVLLENGFLRASLLRTPTRIAALATILENFAPAIAEVKTPTWILWGRNDGIASLRTAKVLAQRLPTARLEVLESSGHDPMSSAPTAVAHFLLEGLAAPAAPLARPTPPDLAATAKPGRCQGQSGMLFQGDYSSIEILACREVRLDGVRAGTIRIRDSVASIERTRVDAHAVALEVSNARVEITASDFAGEVALDASRGEIDLAGVGLQGKHASVHIGAASRLIFSVSRLDSPIGHRFAHEVLELDAGSEF